jgi:hypothetical protein
LRHLELVLEPILDHLERGGHVEDLLAVLNRNDTPVREALPVAAAIHLVHDGRVEISAPQEVRMQRMHDTPFHRARGGGQGLTQHLAAEHLRAADVAALAAKQIQLELFELEQGEHIGRLRLHAPLSSAAFSRT